LLHLLLVLCGKRVICPPLLLLLLPLLLHVLLLLLLLAGCCGTACAWSCCVAVGPAAAGWVCGFVYD
jgi:hypothetical protein